MAARCERHGLAIAEDGRCVRCRRDEEDAEAANTPFFTRTRIAALVGMVVVGGGGGFALWRMEHPKASPAAAPRASSAPAPIAEEAPPLLPLASAQLPTESQGAGNTGANREERLKSAMHRVPITMYCTQDNNDCKRARTWLMSNGYAYADRDVAHDPSADSERRVLTSGVAVPVFDIDGQAISGFDSDRVTRALEYAAAKRIQR